MEIFLLVASLVGFIALTLGTALFVASEFSLTALERSTISDDVDTRGDRRSRLVQRAHSTLSFQLSGAQLGITITTLITGYIAEPAVAELIRPVLEAVGLPAGIASGTATVLSLVLATVLSMVFGELVPKNLAIAHPMEVARSVVWLQAGFAAAFRWLITGLNTAANAIVRRFGIERGGVFGRSLSSAVDGVLSECGQGRRQDRQRGPAQQQSRAIRPPDNRPHPVAPHCEFLSCIAA